MFKKNNFIEHSIQGVLSFLKDSIFSEEVALKKGLLQSLDPRIKVLTFLVLLLQVLWLKDVRILMVFYGFCLALSCLSGVRLWFFLKRTWIFIPLFSLFVAIPAIFSFFTPGDAYATFHVGGIKFVITSQGLAVALLFVGRVLTCVSFAVLLSLTTRHFELLKVLRIFKVPQIFVMTLGMCYRYIYLFVEIIEHTYLAIKSRVGVSVHTQKGQRIVAWNIANLWTRSYQLNEDIYRAMLSRGFTGEPFVLNEFKIKTKDWLWVSWVVMVTFLFIFLNAHIKI
jgi:cobalt/nickel transport system permease protein